MGGRLRHLQPCPNPHHTYDLSREREKAKEKMPRTEEVEWWYAAVYSAVQQIPFGRVTTYGHIAELLGHRTY